MYKNICVIGSSGLLGSEIKKYLKLKKMNFFTVARNNSDFNLNLKNPSSLEFFFKKKNIDLVINCAAIVNIQFCEKKYKDALRINYLLPKFLSRLSKESNFKLVQVSTDQVYKGKNMKANKEISKVFPINNYSKSKILGENEVRKLKKFLIIRTNFTGRRYKKGNSFSDWIFKNAIKNKKLTLFNDMFTSTLDVKTCAKLIVLISLKNLSGIYNLGTRDTFSKKKFAIKFLNKLGKKFRYEETSCDKLNVKRPKNLILDVRKIENKLKVKLPTQIQTINNLAKEYK